MQTQFFFATQCCFYIQEIVLSWCSKSSLPEVGFLILLLPEYGSLIDTTIADRYRCRLFIKSAYTIGEKKIIVMSLAGYFLYCWHRSMQILPLLYLVGQFVHMFIGLVIACNAVAALNRVCT
jgi:hypothetical protein